MNFVLTFDASAFYESENSQSELIIFSGRLDIGKFVSGLLLHQSVQKTKIRFLYLLHMLDTFIQARYQFIRSYPLPPTCPLLSELSALESASRPDHSSPFLLLKQAAISENMNCLQAFRELVLGPQKQAQNELLKQICLQKHNNQQILQNPLCPVLGCTQTQLQQLAVRSLRNKLDLPFIHQLVFRIRANYHPNPYHNFAHAVSLQLIFSHASQRLAQVPDAPLRFVAQIAALCHDMGHQGLTNKYYQISSHSYVKEFGSSGVLEKMHLSRSLRVMEQLNLEKELQRVEKGYREVMGRLILATDMSHHFDTVRRLCQTTEPNQSLLQPLFHAADISNPCVQFTQYLNWSRLLMQQFQVEFNLSARLGVDAGAHMNVSSQQALLKGQYLFIDLIVSPLWKQLGRLQPGVGLWVDQMQENKKRCK